MRKLPYLLGKELRGFIANKYNFLILCIPLLIILLISHSDNTKAGKLPFALIDNEQTNPSLLGVINRLTTFPAFQIIKTADASEAEKLIKRGKVGGAISFSPTTSDTTILEITTSADNSLARELFSLLITEAILQEDDTAIKVQISSLQGVKIPTRIFLIILQLMLPLLGLHMVIQNVIYEKEKGLLEAIKVVGIKEYQITLTKLFFYTLLILCIIAISLILLQEPFSYKLKTLIIFSILAVFYVYIGLQISLISNNLLVAQFYSSIVTITFVVAAVFVDRFSGVVHIEHILPSSAAQRLLLKDMDRMALLNFLLGTLVVAGVFKLCLKLLSIAGKWTPVRLQRPLITGRGFHYRNRTITMAWKSVKEILSLRIIFLLVVFFLLLTSFLLKFLQLPSPQKGQVAVFCDDHKNTRQVLASLQKKTPYSYIQERSVDGAKNAIKQQGALVALVLTTQNRPATFEVIMDDTRQPQAFMVASIIRRTILEETERPESRKYLINFREIRGLNLSYFLFTVFLVIQVVVVTMGLSTVIAKEKQTGVLDALRLTPLTHAEFLMSIAMAAMFISAVVALLMLSASLLNEFDLNIFLITKILLVCLLLALAISSLSVIVFPSLSSPNSVTLAVLELFLILPVALSGVIGIPDTSILLRLNPAVIAQRAFLAILLGSDAPLWVMRLVWLDIVFVAIAIAVWTAFAKIEQGRRLLPVVRI